MEVGQVNETTTFISKDFSSLFTNEDKPVAVNNLAIGTTSEHITGKWPGISEV